MADQANRTGPSIDLKDDIRQAFIVARYEMMKFLSGKKILVFGIINAIVLVAMGAVVIALMKDTSTTEDAMASMISFIGLLALIGATMFSSVTLVSEFEDRTSLVLFTKPIRKASIFMGKFMAAYALSLAFMVVYYLISAVIVLVKTGGFTASMFPSMLYCAIYIFALTGIAMFFSSVMKKSSSASIMTFVFILLVPGIVSAIIAAAMSSSPEQVLDVWYMLNIAEGVITDCITGKATEELRAVIVMLVWGLVPMLASLRIFRNKQV